jgi:hypothetical protein
MKKNSYELKCNLNHRHSPKNCPVWQSQNDWVYECLSENPATKDEYLGKQFLQDSFWEQHSSLEEEEARSRRGVRRLTSRVNDNNNRLQANGVNECIVSVEMSGSHQRVRYFLVLGLTYEEYREIDPRKHKKNRNLKYPKT